VRVPDNASGGKARVTLSYPKRKGRPVAPVTLDIPVVDAPSRQGPPKR